MIIDGRQIERDIEVDICVIGAGPAGLSLAQVFDGSALSVAVIERGSVESPAERHHALFGEIGDGLPYFPLSEARSMGFGGTSNLWPESYGLRSRPLDPIDFERRPAVPDSGWPFGFDELEPFYRAAHHVCRLPEPDYEVATWAREGSQPLDLGDEGFSSAIFKFGSDTAVFKASLSEFSKSENIRVVLNTTVLELVRSAHDAARVGSVVAAVGTKRFRIWARVFVLALGGLENARILLLSRGLNPKGLGNQNDLVGRFFQEHLRIHSGVFEPTDPSLVDELHLYRRHSVEGDRVNAFLTPDPALLRASPLLNTAVYLVPTSRLRTSDSFRSVAAVASMGRHQWGRKDDPIGPHLKSLALHPLAAIKTLTRVLTRREGPSVIQLSLQTEQAPNPSSRVTLGSALDEFGLPVARLEWRLTDLDRSSARSIQEHLDETLRRRGVGRVVNKFGSEEPALPVRGFWHHIGTTRMHTSASSGVLDPDCRIHGVNNVFVAGSSVFPTGGYANPTLTVVAMSIRLGKHLLRMFEGGHHFPLTPGEPRDDSGR